MHSAMAVGLPHGVTEADIGGPEPVVLGACACGCGRTVDTAYEYLRDAEGSVFYEERCVLRFFDVEWV